MRYLELYGQNYCAIILSESQLDLSRDIYQGGSYDTVLFDGFMCSMYYLECTHAGVSRSWWMVCPPSPGEIGGSRSAKRQYRKNIYPPRRLVWVAVTYQNWYLGVRNRLVERSPVFLSFQPLFFRSKV
jgi:hypothetical protein